VRTGVIVDLDCATLTTTSELVAHIIEFLSRPTPGPGGRQFIVLRPLTDMSPSLSFKRDDWPGRITASIEKHFHSDGYGVVEFNSVMPIFEEQRLEAAGLKNSADQPVELQAAFWLVDGGCEWGTNQTEQLQIHLRVQGAGGPEQRFHLTASVREAEQTVLTTLEQALVRTDTLSPAEAANAEAQLLAARGTEMLEGRWPFQPRTPILATPGLRYGQKLERSREIRRDVLANYQRLILLDPKNLEAKTMLGYSLLGDQNPDERERGKELLKEVVDANDPRFTEMAKRHLDKAQWHAQMTDSTAEVIAPSLEMARLDREVAAHPSDIAAKFKLAVMLFHSPDTEDRGNGLKLLMEIDAGGDAEFAAKARELLPVGARSAPKQK
jgi:hypothetical protein